MNILKVVLFLLLVSVNSFCKSLRIFSVLSFGSHSHFTLGSSILRALHDANHSITVVSPFPNKIPMKNYREISTADILEKFKKGKFKNSEIEIQAYFDNLICLYCKIN